MAFSSINGLNIPIKDLNYIPCGVILGKIGVGKTTLFNLLCGTKHLAEEARGSQTQNTLFSFHSCGNYPFNMIDTPGINIKMAHIGMRF
jgi:small GTP-binding protein